MQPKQGALPLSPNLLGFRRNRDSSPDSSQAILQTRPSSMATSSASVTDSEDVGIPPKSVPEDFPFPNEVFEMICKKLIRAGSLDFLRTCSWMYKIGSRFLQAERVLTIKTSRSESYSEREPPSDVPDQRMASVQHVQIKPDAPDFCCISQRDWNLLIPLINSPIPRGTCDVILDTDLFEVGKRQDYLFQLVNILEQCMTFETVTLRSTPRDFVKPCARNPYPSPRRAIPAYLRRQREENQLFRIMLPSWLGPVKVKTDKSTIGTFLEFHPRAFNED